MKPFFLALCCLPMLGCIVEDDFKLPFESLTPVEINDGWALSTPEAEGMDSQKLGDVYRDFHDDTKLWMVRSLVVVRNGRLVAESYTKDRADLDQPRAIWSCTKQYLGMLVGIAIDQGLIGSVKDPIGTYLPAALEKHPDKRDITIENLLMMQSGITWENFGIGGDNDAILRQNPPDFLEYTLSKPMATLPGTEFDYKDSDPQILSAVLEATAGKSTREWADEVLFSRIGTRNYSWLTYRDGSTIGAFGIVTTPRELARFAQVVLDEGRHDEETIVSEAWITEMTKPHVDLGNAGFGYQWWSISEEDLPYMAGSGRQIVFLFPDKELLVVMTSEENTQGPAMLGTSDAFNYASRIAALAN